MIKPRLHSSNHYSREAAEAVVESIEADGGLGFIQSDNERGMNGRDEWYGYSVMMFTPQDVAEQNRRSLIASVQAGVWPPKPV